jgi:hypothetical protein
VAGLKEKIGKTRLREEDDAGKQSRVGGVVGVSLSATTGGGLSILRDSG